MKRTTSLLQWHDLCIPSQVATSFQLEGRDESSQHGAQTFATSLLLLYFEDERMKG